MNVLAIPLDPPLPIVKQPRDESDDWLVALGVSPREASICRLLLTGMCYTNDFAREMDWAPRTVKAYFNRLYLRFHITSGYKRVVLAGLLYRARRRWQELH